MAEEPVRPTLVGSGSVEGYRRSFARVTSVTTRVLVPADFQQWDTVTERSEEEIQREREEYLRSREEQIKRQQERQVAEHRALELLEQKIGQVATAKILTGGAYPVGSKLWQGVVYYVPKDPQQRIRVMSRGTLVMESCLISADCGLPWPDVMLQRILAIETDETVVVGTGVVHQKVPGLTLERLRAGFRRMLRI